MGLKDQDFKVAIRDGKRGEGEIGVERWFPEEEAERERRKDIGGEGERGGDRWNSEEEEERERRKDIGGEGDGEKKWPRIKMARKKIGRRKERGRYVVRRASTLKRDGLEGGTKQSRKSAAGDFSDWSLGSGSGNGREGVTEIGPEHLPVNRTGDCKKSVQERVTRIGLEYLPVSSPANCNKNVQERVTESGSERVPGSDPDLNSKESSLHVKRAKIRDSV
jgi:hypothetical protein